MSFSNKIFQASYIITLSVYISASERVLKKNENWTPTAMENLHAARQAQQNNLTFLDRQVRKSQQKKLLQPIPFPDNFENTRQESEKSVLNHPTRSTLSFKKPIFMPSKKEQQAIARQERQIKAEKKLQEQYEQKKEERQNRIELRQQTFNNVDKVQLQETETPIKEKIKQRIPQAPSKSLLHKNSPLKEVIVFNLDNLDLVALSSSEEELPTTLPTFSFGNVVTPEKQELAISSQFSNKRPAALRNRNEKARINERSKTVEEFSEFSGKIWDYRAHRNLIEGRK